MVHPSQFYKVIGEKNYDLLVKNNILPDKDKLMIINMSDKVNEYKLGMGKIADTTYGRKLQDIIFSALKTGDLTSINTYIPNLAVDKFKEICGYDKILPTLTSGLETTTGSKGNEYDIMYCNALIDIKTSKKPKFSSPDINSFILQLSIYYAKLSKELQSRIKYIVILNPINNLCIYTSISYIKTDELLHIYDSYDSIIVDYFTNKKLISEYENMYENKSFIVKTWNKIFNKSSVNIYKIKYKLLKAKFDNIRKLCK